MADEWYIAKDGKQLGPFTSKAMRELASAGRLLPDDLIWKDGLSKWVQAIRIENLFPKSEPAVIPADRDRSRKAQPETIEKQVSDNERPVVEWRPESSSAPRSDAKNNSRSRAVERADFELDNEEDNEPDEPVTRNSSRHGQDQIVSGAATGFSIGGMAIGIVALTISIIPCFGAIAIYPGVLATFLSVIALVIMLASKSKVSGLVIPALVISILSVLISAFWILQIHQAGESMLREVEKSKKN